MDVAKLMTVVKNEEDIANELHVSEEGKIFQLAQDVNISSFEGNEGRTGAEGKKSKKFSSKVECPICNKLISDRRNLSRHMHTIHDIQPNIRRLTMKCSFSEQCSFSCRISRTLRRHLESVHGFIIVQSTLHFHNRIDFEKWKEEEEIKICACYVTDTGVKYRNEKKIYYLRCHRSGPIRAEQNVNKQRLRSKPSRGYTQCGLTCPSSMQVVEDQYGNIEVQYFPKHLGHGTDNESIKYMRLRKKEKEEITAKLVQGVPIGKIVREARIRKGKNLSRFNLLERRDVYNIKSKVAFLEKEIDHDGKMIDSWIKRLGLSNCPTNSPIAMYKPIDSDNDYILVIIHHVQKIVFSLLFDGSVIYVKTKKGKANLDFNLTVAFFVNENGDGYPLAFCLSSKVDYSTISEFFQVIHGAFGLITAQIFISNNVGYYYTAWKGIMSKTENKLICNFNIHSVWEQKLIELKCPLKKYSFLLRKLKYILNEMDTDVFQSQLINLLNFWKDDEEIKPFLKYFYKFYFKKPFEWANCYRMHSIRKENINKYLEPLYNHVESIYSEGTHNIHSALTSILLLVRSECYMSLIKLDEDMVNDKIMEIERNHAASKDVLDIKFDGNHWKVCNSESDYVVKKQDSVCGKQCNIICYSCDICVHCYSCVCCDYLANFSICTHIHAVASSRFSKFGDFKCIPEKRLLASSDMKFSAVSLSKTVTEFLEQSDLPDVQYDKIISVLDNLIKDHSPNDRFQDNLLRKILCI